VNETKRKRQLIISIMVLIVAFAILVLGSISIAWVASFRDATAIEHCSREACLTSTWVQIKIYRTDTAKALTKMPAPTPTLG
jgi:hypothetical protein